MNQYRMAFSCQKEKKIIKCSSFKLLHQLQACTKIYGTRKLLYAKPPTPTKRLVELKEISIAQAHKLCEGSFCLVQINLSSNLHSLNVMVILIVLHMPLQAHLSKTISLC